MTVCTSILLGASFLVWTFVSDYYNKTGERMKVRVFFSSEPIDAFTWVYTMVGFFSTLYAATAFIVLRHCSGYFTLSVNDKENQTE